MKCLKKVTQITDIYLLTKHYFRKNLLKKLSYKHHQSYAQNYAKLEKNLSICTI